MNGKHTSEAKRILWFAPTAGLWASAELENDLANAWARAGHEITVIRCRGVLKSYCPVMTAEGLAANAPVKAKEVACRECRFNASILDSPEYSRYSTVWLDDFVTTEISRSAKQLVESVTKDNWMELQSGVIPVGRYASYLTLLHHKVPTPAAHDAAWQEYTSDLYNSLITMAALPAIFDRIAPDLVSVYNPLYPTNRMFIETALARGLPLVSVTAGGYIPDRYSTIALYPAVHSSQTARDSRAIAAGMDQPLSKVEITAVTRHAGQQMLGNDPWVYTSAPVAQSTGEIRQRLGLRPAAPVVVALVGSPDETRSSALVDAEYDRTAAPLSDVVEFIAQTLQAARSLPDVDFVIRLHPRLSANKREKLDSPDLVALFEALEDCPPNAHVNKAGDGIGLYDTARIASVGLNHASTSGLEFLLLGIPVVHYDPARLNAYPPEFGHRVERLQNNDLVSSLSGAIGEGWSLDNSRRAYRWLGTTLIRSLIHRKKLEPSSPQQDSQESFSSAPSQGFQPRELIPRSLREKFSRHQARSARQRDFTEHRERQASGARWEEEAARRLAQLAEGDVWEPLVIPRGESLSADSELHMIQAHVQLFIERLGGLEIMRSPHV